jgi:hypothetical protein
MTMSSTGSSRGNPAMGDILRSLFVIGAIILALWGIGRLFTTTPDNPAPAIDYAQVVSQARPAADFKLLAPDRLPSGWKATSARFEPSSWHLGVLTKDKDYIGLEQVKVSVDRAVDRFAEDSKAAGEAEVSGATWTVRTGPKGDDITYVRREDGLTTLVTGNAPRAVVEDYVASLSAGST